MKGAHKMAVHNTCSGTTAFRIFDLLNEIKLFIENKGRNSKNLKDGG
jgi:hypothetical protein